MYTWSAELQPPHIALNALRSNPSALIASDTQFHTIRRNYICGHWKFDTVYSVRQQRFTPLTCVNSVFVCVLTLSRIHALTLASIATTTIYDLWMVHLIIYTRGVCDDDKTPRVHTSCRGLCFFATHIYPPYTQRSIHAILVPRIYKKNT